MLTKLNPIFLERLKEIYNREEYEEILASFLLEKRKTSFRINTLQGNKEEVEAELIKNAIDFHHLDFLENCYVIETGKERDLWNLECYKQGKIYIQ
jgi:16S rRNA C967 or C1407 C5-methylase (RsmB/RsmF family)